MTDALASAAPPPTGVIAFLFTDVEGSTQLWERHADQMGPALAEHDLILRRNIEDGGGYVFTTAGDAFAAAFHTPTQALSAAASAQLDLQAHAWPDGVAIRVRMGVHTGLAQQRTTTTSARRSTAPPG